MNNSGGVGIIGIGSCLPDKILTNFDLEKMVDTSDEWIIKRTGISERRILEKEKPAYELGVKASLDALKDAGISAEDLDMVIVATATPDYMTPSTACIIQGKIGAIKAAAFDLNAACSGFVYSLSIAEKIIKSGTHKYILVVGCEGLSKVTDYEDRNTCILFGDGAGAVVLGPVEEGYGILSTHIGADGKGSDLITIPNTYISEVDLSKRLNLKKYSLWMEGSEVFKFAVRIIAQASNKALEDANLSLDDIKLIVPHQANIRIIDGAAKRLGVPIEKLYTNIQKYGNISSASIPVALHEVVENKLITKGDNILIVGFGGGLTWASAVIKWNKY